MKKLKSIASTAVSPAIALIAAERKRQIVEEFFTAESDIAMNPKGELAAAAACYAMPKEWSLSAGIAMEKLWPWEAKWWKLSADRKREIIVAGALLISEWDRLDAEEKANAEKK